MAQHIEVVDFPARQIAVVQRSYTIPELSRIVPSAIGEVWNWLRKHPEIKPGRNVAYYVTQSTGLFGVEVAEPFVSDSEVLCMELAGPRAIWTEHLGPYSGLKSAYDAIHEWISAHPEVPLGNACWEIYGHWKDEWNNDPSKILTEIFFAVKSGE